MACGSCGKRPPKNSPAVKKPNKKEGSLKKYAFLHPNQIAILEAQEKEEEENKI